MVQAVRRAVRVTRRGSRGGPESAAAPARASHRARAARSSALASSARSVGPLPSSRTGRRAGGSPIRSHSSGTTVGRSVAVRGMRPVTRPPWNGVDPAVRMPAAGPAPGARVRPAPGAAGGASSTTRSRAPAAPAPSPPYGPGGAASPPDARRAARRPGPPPPAPVRPNRPPGRPGTAERGGDQRVEVVDEHDEPGQRGGPRSACRTGRRRAQPERASWTAVEVRGADPGAAPAPRRAGAALGRRAAATIRPDSSRRVCHSAKSEPPSSSARRFSSALSACANSRIRTGSLAARCVGDMRQVRAGPQPLAALAAPPPSDRSSRAEPVGPLGGGERGGDGAQQLRTAAARRALDQQMRALVGQVDGDRAARARRRARPGRPPAPRVVGRVAQRAISDAGVARASPSSSSSRADWGSGRGRGAGRAPRRAVRAQRRERPREPLGPGRRHRVHRGDRAVARRAGPPAVRISRSAVATSPLSRATAPHSRNGERGRARRLVRRGDRGERARRPASRPGRSDGSRRPRPAPASRAVVSRSAAEPGSPSTIDDGVRAPSYRRGGLGDRPAVGATAQPGPSGPSSSRRVQLGGAGGGLVAVVREQQPAVLAVRGAQMRQPAEPGPLGACAPPGARARSVLISTISRSTGECSAASWATADAGQPGQPRPRPGEPERTGLAQADGHRHGGQLPAVGAGGRRAEPHGERLGVRRAALPQPGARARAP